VPDGAWLTHHLLVGHFKFSDIYSQHSDFTYFSEHDPACCQEGYQPTPPLKYLSCFHQLLGVDSSFCLDPVQVFASVPRTRRCSSNTQCATVNDRESLCLRLDPKERVLRIGYRSPAFLRGRNVGFKEEEEEVLLWNGPRREVLLQGLISLLMRPSPAFPNPFCGR
jgi:hypothetical protein